jgi:thioester reductase-like protein
LVRLNIDGDLEYIERADFQVKIRGYRIELGEIENTLMKIPGINQAIVIVSDDDLLFAYYTGKEIANEVILDELNEILPSYMVPRFYMYLDEVPLNNSGKVDRKKLPKIIIDRKGDEFIEPKTRTQKELVSIVSDLLGVEEGGVSVDDNLFYLGLDSIKAIQFSNIVNYRMNIGIKVEDIFKRKTIRLIADNLSKKQSDKGINQSDKGIKHDMYHIDEELDHMLKNQGLENLTNTNSENIGNVLLTGASGFLGIHILHEFLENEKGNIYCMIRKKEDIDPWERLKSLLSHYFNKNHEQLFEDKFYVIEGDVRRKDDFDKCLKYPIDTVINTAANVKHYSSGTQIEDVNVRGVINCIDFCKMKNSKLIHISTESVAGLSVNGIPSLNTMFSEKDLYVGQNLENKYVSSKFKGEKLILDSVLSKEINARIMRVGNLMARYKDGKFQINFNTNAFINRLKSFKIIGHVPINILNQPIEISPIDFTANAVLLLSKTPNEFVIFHPFNNHKTTLGNIINSMNKLDLKIKESRPEEFEKGLKKVMDNELNFNKLSLLPLLNQENEVNPVHVVNDYTTEVLDGLGFKWPHITSEYLDSFIKNLKSSCFFE